LVHQRIRRHPAPGWSGWPDGKKFALVLTHDVEGPEGLADTGAIEHNPEIRKRLSIVIENLKMIDSLREVHGIKKIEGYENYFRMRLGDYRLGLKLTST